MIFRVNTTRQFKGISSKLSAFSAIQNEMIEIDVAQIIKIILSETICFFSIIDETMDLSRHEQVSICVCYIDQQIMIKEKFIGFFRDRKMNSTTATALCDLILNVLENLGLDYKTKLVGQCYDGAANMSGIKNGVNKKIHSQVKKALYIHCNAHQLNLALQHSCNDIHKARNCLEILNSLHDFIEGSAKRHALFELIQESKYSIVLEHLSDTRWASRSASLSAMKMSYSSVI